jgi:peptidoglycan hydrolase-like protein with peptidoglycan-binding domain
MRRLLTWAAAIVLMLAVSGPALANGRADYIGSLDPALIRHIQKVLKDKGLYRGGIDGGFGAGTKRAIVQFRTANGIAGEADEGQDLTYYLTPKLADKLLGVRVRTQASDLQELSTEEQLKILRALRLTPVRKYDDAVAPE